MGDIYPSTAEMEWRIDSQRKEIERLRDEALARNAVIGKLQADKVALSEMLARAIEHLRVIADYDIQVDLAFLERAEEMVRG